MRQHVIGFAIGFLIAFVLTTLLVAPPPAHAQGGASRVVISAVDYFTGREAPVAGAASRLLVHNSALANAFVAQNATGQTPAFDAGGAAQHRAELVVTGTPAGCTYRLQGSIDTATWVDISAADITCTSSAIAYEANKPTRYVRGNLLTLSGGTAPTVTLKYAGY